MNIVRWNPFRELDQVFDRYMLPVPGTFAENAHDWQPLVDIRETDDAYRVDLELPAIDPKDVSVTLQDGVLQVSGERRFADAIRATAKDGVVSIAVSKSAKATPRAIEVELA